MPRRDTKGENRRRIGELEAELGQAYWGELPWRDLPTEPGWYWILIGPSTVVRGPARVRLIAGRLVGQVLSDAGGEKPVEHFGRRWAGPLPRPVDPDGPR
jgi:hypothetical protein